MKEREEEEGRAEYHESAAWRVDDGAVTVVSQAEERSGSIMHTHACYGGARSVIG